MNVRNVFAYFRSEPLPRFNPPRAVNHYVKLLRITSLMSIV
jgi:hypothetical protein